MDSNSLRRRLKMEEIDLAKVERPLSELKDVFSVSDAASFLARHKIGIVIILDYVKARDWPWKGHPLTNEPTEKIPLLWAIFDPVDNSSIRVVWDIHPAKCFPQRYNRYNPNSIDNTMPIVTQDEATLAGCSRTFVTMSKRRYEVAEKTPEYCSIFGLPDDCYDPLFETRMIDTLKSYQKFDLWCFERTEFIRERVEPSVKLRYMKGEFLPSRHFMYVDTPGHFLRGVFGSRELETLSSQLWYSSGKELIEEMNLGNKDFCFRFEEQATYYLRKRLIYEFVRLILLLSKKEAFSSFAIAGSPKLCLDKEKETKSKLCDITASIERDTEVYIARVLNRIKKRIDFQSFRNSRFMVADAEYLHVPYPTGGTSRFFNFPCIFFSIVWRGTREGISANTNVFLIPCHFCEEPCSFLKKKLFNYNCLAYGGEFIDRQATFTEGMLSRYENFKIYTYGRSDAFQLEQGSDFFSDSFERQRYERRNRKRAKRIVDLSEDLSVPGKGLTEIEHETLEKWLAGWSRLHRKLNVNSRFMTPYCSRN